MIILIHGIPCLGGRWKGWHWSWLVHTFSRWLCLHTVAEEDPMCTCKCVCVCVCVCVCACMHVGACVQALISPKRRESEWVPTYTIIRSKEIGHYLHGIEYAGKLLMFTWKTTSTFSACIPENFTATSKTPTSVAVISNTTFLNLRWKCYKY